MSAINVYQEYFGLREPPFSITPDPRFVYLSDSHRAALEHLVHGATDGGSGFVLLTGGVGTGKTTICRTFLEKLPSETQVILILNPVLTLNEFLQTICDELDLVIAGSRNSNKNLIDHLNRFLLQVYAVGHKTLLIIDEAQNLTHELLEQIRLLTNLESNTDKLLQIFLIGQPELRNLLDRPEMAQVAQRITSRYHLTALDKREMREYIDTRLAVAGGRDIRFTNRAIGRIFAFSKGVPRLVNVLCDKALFCAYQQSKEIIDHKIIAEAEQRVLGSSGARSGSVGSAVRGLAVLAALVVAALAIAYWADVADIRQRLHQQWEHLGGEPVTALTNPPPEVAASEPEPAATAADPVQPLGSSSRIAPAAIPAGDKAEVAGTASYAEQVAADATGPSEHTTNDATAVAAEPAGTAEAAQTAATLEPAGAAAAAPVVETGASAEEARGNTVEARPAAADAAREDPVVPPDAMAAEPPPARTDVAATGRNRVAPNQSLSDYTRQYAERKLLSMWGVSAAQTGGLDFCRDAAVHGLSCLSESSGLPGLYRYDRPAILYLRIGDVSSYAVVMKASSQSVVLDVLDREHVIPADALREVWDGDFLVLWRRPGEVERNLALGAAGRAVVWLRRALDLIDGSSTTGDFFDEQLLARVKRFQAEQGLSPDGIVGPRTLILLQNRLAKAAS